MSVENSRRVNLIRCNGSAAGQKQKKGDDAQARTKSEGHSQRLMPEYKNSPKARTENDSRYQRENKPYLQFPHFVSKFVNWQVLDILQQSLHFFEAGTTAYTRRAPSDRVISNKQSSQRTHLPNRRHLPRLEEIGRRNRYWSHHRRNIGGAPRPRRRPNWRHWWALNICRRNWSRFRCPSSASVPPQPGA